LQPVAASFVMLGVFAGAWAVAVIDVERAFDLSDSGLGVLLAAGILAATAMAAVGGLLVDRVGAGVALTGSLLAWGVLLALQVIAPSLATFAPVFVLGMTAGGLIDVVMNVIAADVLAGEPSRLVRFHALFNAGAVVGAVVAGIALRAGASWRVVWFVIAVGALTVGIASRLAHVPEPPPRRHPSMVHALAELRHEGLLVLAIVFGASAMVEGGIATWGVLYLRAHLGVGVIAGVGAYVAGQVLATAARTGSGPLIDRLGSRRAVFLGAGIAAAGIVAEALCRTAAIAAIGLAAASVGISVVWPLLLATVNNEARDPVLAIGGVTACGYLGMVAGPPIVGTLSGPIGLRGGLLVLAGVAVFVAATPARLRPRTRAGSVR
jgi:MFS family permease